MELEAAGDAAQAGLIGAALERPAGQAGEAGRRCADCGGELIGPFCHACGQPAKIHRSLLQLGEELLHGVMHFDGRLWRTLPLLAFLPGRLTREWVQGRRTRYVSPLTMFLFTIFVTFMLLSFLPAAPGPTLTQQRAEAARAVVDAAAEVAAAEQELGKADPAGRPRAQTRVEKAREDLTDAQVAAAALRGAAAAADPAAAIRELPIDLGNKKLEEKLRQKLENPELALYKLQQSFYKFSFLLVPISLPFVAVLFLWRRSVTFYDHGVFILYSLTFVSVLLMLTTLLVRTPGGWGAMAVSAVPFIIPAHMFFQLKGAYELGFFAALWRTLLLLMFCAVALVCFVLAVVYLGLV